MATIHRSYLSWISQTVLTVLCLLAGIVLCTIKVSALTPISPPDPLPGSYGLEATKKKAPPTVGATITTPGNGSSYSSSPITVTGICPNGLLVQIYNNNVMVGAVMCQNGSFSVQVSLFAGINELSALVYDELDQAGPMSNIVTVNYTDTSFTAFGSLVTLTSSYGRRAAPAGSTLSWPLQLSGGNGPYAFSIDWGDGSKPVLKSHALAGVVMIDHAYKRAGIYRVNITVTDVNGVTAFLQIVAVASGKVDGAVSADAAGNSTENQVKILWVPAAISAGLLVPSFWLGRQSQLTSLRNRMLKDRDSIQ
jgi:hypothetical protein